MFYKLPLPWGERGGVRGQVSREVNLARTLRRRETDAERKLWRHLRDRKMVGAKFRRQQPLGPFIVDFCCLEHRLIVELDGGHHLNQALEDGHRSAWLEKQGYSILRFWDHEILSPDTEDAVLVRIANAITHPHPSPLPSREREEERVEGIYE